MSLTGKIGQISEQCRAGFVIDRLVAWSAEQWPESIRDNEEVMEVWLT